MKYEDISEKWGPQDRFTDVAKFWADVDDDVSMGNTILVKITTENPGMIMAESKFDAACIKKLETIGSKSFKNVKHKVIQRKVGNCKAIRENYATVVYISKCIKKFA